MKQTTWAKESEINRKWFIVDLEGKTLGRVATQIADILRGKKKVNWTPNIDCGDYVIAINASKVKLTGNKLKNKIYYNHSQWKGGLRQRNAEVMIEKYPIEMFERAVKGMLQKNSLGRKQFRKLYVFASKSHNMEAQKPEKLEI